MTLPSGSARRREREGGHVEQLCLQARRMRSIPRLAIASQGDPEQLLAEVCAEAPALFHADGVAIFIEDGLGAMRVQAAAGFGGPFSRWASLPQAEMAAIAERDGEVSIFHAAGRTPRCAWEQATAQAGMTSALWAPIRAGGRIVGGLLVGHQAAGYTFDDDDRLFAEVLAEYLGSRLVELRLRRAFGRVELALQRAARRALVGDLAWEFTREAQHPICSILDRIERAVAALAHTPAPPQLRGAHEAIVREARRMRTMMDALLDFGGRDPAERARATVSELVDTVLNLVGWQLARDGIAVEVTWDEELPPVNCRPAQIEQVLLDLVGMARRSLNRRFPVGNDAKVLRLEARPGRIGGVPCAEIEIWDAGGGISPARLERLLAPLPPDGPPATEDDEEEDALLGPALTVCREVLRDHDGSLHVESEEGAYTRVLLELPLAEMP